VLRVVAAGEGGTGTEADDTAVRMKLIAITGYGRDADLALAREAGFDGHMVKPCDLDELEKMMAEPELRM
jgi:CheY-like chemotaxis protein